jgi:hypothetical protein
MWGLSLNYGNVFWDAQKSRFIAAICKILTKLDARVMICIEIAKNMWFYQI